MQRWSNKSESRSHNMGINSLKSYFSRMIENKVSLVKNTFTLQSEICSGAVALVDVGMSMPNLKRAGRWASTPAMKQYIEHSHVSKAERRTAQKKQKSTTAAKKIVKSTERSSEI
eukprot:7327522-Ditylum_brightwellii.AAC.1